MAKKETEQSFETAVTRLEELVRMMQEGGTLDEMLANYQEGMKLAEQCRDRLDKAQLKMTELTKNEG